MVPALDVAAKMAPPGNWLETVMLCRKEPGAGCPAVGQVKKVGKVGHFWQKVGQK